MDPVPILAGIVFVVACVLGSLLASIRVTFSFFRRYTDRIENEKLLAVAQPSVEFWKKDGYAELVTFWQIILDAAVILSGTYLFHVLSQGYLPLAGQYGLGLAVAVIVEYLVIRQLIPTLIQSRMEKFAQPLYLAHSFLWLLFGWFGEAVYKLKVWMLKRSGFLKQYKIFSETDLQKLDTESNGLEDEEAEMVQNVINIGNTVVKEIFTPRVDCIALDVSSTYEQVMEIIQREKYTRIPVYEGNIDSIVGVLHVKDLLFIEEKGETFDLRDHVRPAYFIPRSKKVDELMTEFRQEKNHLAIVVDEYGGTAGLITLEDILEEIVGEIQDEDDTEAPKISRIDENTFFVDPIISLDEINRTLDLHIKPKEEVEIDTLGGYLQYLKGSVPQEGDTISQNGYAFEILKMDGQSIEKVRLTVQSSESSP